MTVHVVEISVEVDAMLVVFDDGNEVKPLPDANRTFAHGIAAVHHPMPDDTAHVRAELKYASRLVLIVAVVLRNDAIGPAFEVPRVVTDPDRQRDRTIVDG